MVLTIWNAWLIFDLLPTGSSNRDLRANLAALRGQPMGGASQTGGLKLDSNTSSFLAQGVYRDDPLAAAAFSFAGR
jgi:hypothetical protein